MTADTLRLAWPAPAAEWVEAIPIGNGRIGAMVFGGIVAARFQLNDSTAWSGDPDGPARALAAVLAGGAGPQRLAEVRAAIDRGDFRAAEELLMSFEGPYSQEFLPLADLEMAIAAEGEAAYGGRELDLDDAVVTERFALGGARFVRRSWVSAPDGALCILLESDAAVDVTLALSSPLRVASSAATGDGLSLGVEIPVDGAPLHEPRVAEPHVYRAAGAGGFYPFATVHAAVDTDGAAGADGGRLTIRAATRVLVTVATATRAESWWSGVPAGDSVADHRPDTAARARDRAGRAVRRGHELLLDDHLADVRGLRGATRVAIGGRRAGVWDVARDILAGDDDELTATVMAEFGRYLLASSSRPGSPPANLQGIWNEQLRPPWSSNYTININTQMNYWAAEVGGLADTHLPLAELLAKVADNGRKVAAGLYGARGWVAHHNTDIWGWALPVGMGHGNPSWAIWPMGGVWLSHHLWDHYDFTRDAGYLRDTAWPILRGAAEFCLDWLVDDGRGGLRTIPSTSPENLFVGPDGSPQSLSSSVSMDVALIRSLFERCRLAIAELGIHDGLDEEIADALERMPRQQVSADGRIREWGPEVTEADPHHRHLSPMVGLYPLDLITPEDTPGLAEAARLFLDGRGPGAMGWSWAWKIALRARLGDGETALALLREATQPLERDHTRLAPVDGSEWGGLLPNLFSTHPPFQVDGNYGFTAGILEMLVQSHRGRIRLLPALPASWRNGSAVGVGARGGLRVDLAWADGALLTASLHNLTASAVTVPVECQGVAIEVAVPPFGTADAALPGVGHAG